MPYINHIKHWTAVGGPMEAGVVSDATMTRLLAGAVGACRDPDVYPFTTIVATHHVMVSITVEDDISKFSTTVLTAMEAKVAREMGVASGNVDIKASAGSVVLTINIGYENADTAATASTTMAAAMSDKDAAATMLTTDTMTISSVTEVGTPTSGTGAMAASPPSSPPPKAKTDSDDGLSVGAIAGIAIGASVAVILVAAGALFAMNKKKTVTATKGNP
jgi:hypothetical protein